MNLATILILVLIAAAFLFAVRYTIMHKNACGSCKGCSGGNASCSKTCAKNSQAQAEEFRQKRLEDIWEHSK